MAAIERPPRAAGKLFTEELHHVCLSRGLRWRTETNENDGDSPKRAQRKP